MQPLSAVQIVQLWELGQGQHALDRSLTCLAFALPERSLEDLANFSLGRRDGYLLTLRERTFGPDLNSVASCPNCQEALEFTLAIADLRVGDPELDSSAPQVWEGAGTQFKFRLPNSLDLAASLGVADPAAAQQALLERCVLAASHQGREIAIAELPPTQLTELGNVMTQADPQADITLDLQCPACSYRWQVVFDIGEFLWIEITAYAQRLLADVHRLARVYGWREADILAMSSHRRQYYLNLVS